jgi:ssDNA-binding replication factor A large subunit
MAKKTKKKAKKTKKKTEPEEDFWEEDKELEEEVEEEINVSKLKFIKIKDLEIGMEHINIKATIDFVGDVMGKGYGEAPFALGFLKDSTGEVKVTFWGDDIKKAKPKKDVQIINCSVGEYRGQLQLYPDKKRGIEFL